MAKFIEIIDKKTNLNVTINIENIVSIEERNDGDGTPITLSSVVKGGFNTVFIADSNYEIIIRSIYDDTGKTD